jgi:hypothetical protein
MSSFLPPHNYNTAHLSSNHNNFYFNGSQAPNYGSQLLNTAAAAAPRQLPSTPAQHASGPVNYFPSASFANLPTRQASFAHLPPRQASFINLPSSYSSNNLPLNLNNNTHNLNHDPNPLIVRKKSQPVHYNQNISVRFIKPEPLPPHGDIIIKHLPDSYVPPPPPHHIRNPPPPPAQEPTRIIREAPPVPPPRLPDQVFSIPGRRIQSPRKIIIENYAEVPLPRTECRVVYDTPNLFVRPQEAVCFNF